MIAKDAKSGKQIKIEYVNKKITGNGSFGVVYQTRLIDTNEDAAIKKVLQDRRFKVNDMFLLFCAIIHFIILLESRVTNYAIIGAPQCMSIKVIFLQPSGEQGR